MLHRHIYHVLQLCEFDIDMTCTKLGITPAKLKQHITALQTEVRLSLRCFYASLLSNVAKGYNFGQYDDAQRARKSRRLTSGGRGKRKNGLASTIYHQPVISDKSVRCFANELTRINLPKCNRLTA
jgi:hypothetical protein